MSASEILPPDVATDRERARFLGAFYTPSSTAELLADWGVRDGFEVILEPSAGGGALIEAAQKKSTLLTTAAQCKVYAFDIDPFSISALLANKRGDVVVAQKDFLAVTPEAIEKVDLVLSNPPFTRNHSLTKDRRAFLRKAFNAPSSAGLWAYFLLHSLSFLKLNGRLASVVPNSILFTAHGKKIIDELCTSFSSVGVYSLKEKQLWSSRADEGGAVIFAEGYKSGECQSYSAGRISVTGEVECFPSAESDIYKRLLKGCCSLGEIAKISIGAVTGRNSVFLLSERERLDAKICIGDICPVVSRARHVKGLKIKKSDLFELAELGEKTWLLQPLALTPSIESYLSVIPDKDRESVVWFRKRDPWWRVQTAVRYDAVLTYMNDAGPRLALLDMGLVCTNTLHSVTFFTNIDEGLKRSASLTLISSFGQLVAEKVGRFYGGGVLKFEINEARKLPVFRGEGLFSESLYNRVDELIKGGESAQACDLVDSIIFSVVFQDDWKIALKNVKNELFELRQRRLGKMEKEI